MLKVRRFVIVFLVSIMCLLIAPFHVYAFSISQSNVKGVNYSIVDIIPTNEQYQQNGNTYVKCAFIHRFEVVFDQQFLGYITGQLSGNYQAYNSTGTFTSYNAQSGSRSFYISGYSFEYYLETFAYMMINQIDNYSNTYSATFNLAGSNVTNIDYTARMLEDIEDILYNAENIYTSVYDADNGTVIEQLVDVNEELDFIHEMVYYINNNVANIENDTDILSKLRQYNVPIFSYNIVLGAFRLFDTFTYQYFNKNNYFEYPSFIIPANTSKVQLTSAYLGVGATGYCIFGTTGNLPFLQDVYTLETLNGVNVNIVKRELLYSYLIQGYSEYKIYKYTFDVPSGASVRMYINNNLNEDLIFTPILLVNSYTYNEFPMEFALTYHMNNRELDYLNIIANGTALSNDSSERLEEDKDDMQTQFNDMFDYEDDFNNDMNNALQNINVNFDVGNQLGSKFLASADWVRQQYNTLTNNTPFGTVLSFSLLLGLALLIIGKAVR